MMTHTGTKIFCVIKPDHSKVEAIQIMSPPQDKAAVERLRGTVNYLSKFVPNLSDVMYPIYNLARPTSDYFVFLHFIFTPSYG